MTIDILLANPRSVRQPISYMSHFAQMTQRIVTTYMPVSSSHFQEMCGEKCLLRHFSAALFRGAVLAPACDSSRCGDDFLHPPRPYLLNFCVDYSAQVGRKEDWRR